MQEQLTNLRVLKCFCVKMLGYFYYIHSLHKESAHFSLEVLKPFGLEASKHFEFKNSYKKN